MTTGKASENTKVATRKHDNREVLWMRADTLTVAPEYQRALNARRVRKIVNEFDPDVLGVLEISERPDGQKVIIDGQHRWHAIMDMQWGDQLVPVIIHYGLTLQDEARVFRKRNKDAVQPKPIELFHAELVEKLPEAMAIQAVVENLGLKIDLSNGPGSIRAVSSVRHVFNVSGAIVLGRTLRVIRDAWGLSVENFHAEVIKGIGLFITRYPNLDQDRLIEVLRREDVHSLRQAARTRMRYTSYPTQVALVLCLTDMYNLRLKTKSKRLPQWVFVPDTYLWRSHDFLKKEGLVTGEAAA